MQLNALRHHATRLLPASLVDYLRKRRRQRAAALRRRTRETSIASHGQFDAAELVATLRTLGIPSGCVLLVQSSFNDMHTFSGRPSELLDALRASVGPDGTLLMPAYTTEPQAGRSGPLDVETLPTYTGIVNELFRRSPGVQRSRHPRHSLCAQGPLAAELLAGHESCLYADGPDSPFDRLRQRDDAFIVTLALPAGFTSFLHWIEDIAPERLPVQVHEAAAKVYDVRGPTGQTIVVRDMQVRPEIASRLDLAPVARALTRAAFRLVRHRGIDIGIYAVRPFSEQLIALRDQGVFHYH
jgi:aminoglycoside N3'-acetyltransferase